MTLLAPKPGPPAGAARVRPRLRRLILLLVLALIGLASVIVWFSGPNSNPLAHTKLYVIPDSQAVVSTKRLAAMGATSDASQMNRLASQPSAEWFSSGTPEQVETRAHMLAKAAAADGSALIGVVYNLPRRDCASQPLPNQSDSYRQWILGLYRGLDLGTANAHRTVILIYEPDSIALTVGQTACVTGSSATERWQLESETIRKLKSLAGVRIYLDAGNSGWFDDPHTLVGPLKQAGASQADGLAINVANFQTTSDSLRYGDALSKAMGGMHYVIDTSRNGAGPYTDSKNEATDPTWCNPPGRTPGPLPTTNTGHPNVDAYLWIKHLGESDGACRPGESPAGSWMPTYALGVMRRLP
jgi:endoglucanase